MLLLELQMEDALDDSGGGSVPLKAMSLLTLILLGAHTAATGTLIHLTFIQGFMITLSVGLSDHHSRQMEPPS